MDDCFLMALSLVSGMGRRKILGLLRIFKTPKAIRNASEQELIKVRGITAQNAKAINKAGDEKYLKDLSTQLENDGIQYFSILNNNFPKLLREINDPPVGIYVRGTLPPSELDTVAVIGARRCSSYGANVAYKLSKDLAKANIVVVSGMAEGIDSKAHMGILDGGGKTIAVLGCGVNICYPSHNKQLMERIIQNGCVISEYPPQSPPFSGNFPVRNRIISGLSRMVIVVEASKKSGTMITADQALENGREVFVVPGNVTSSLSVGTNDLIRQGCPIITNFEDVLFELGISYNDTEKQNFIANKTALSDEEHAVYQHISQEPITAEHLATILEQPVQDILYILSLLELYGYIKKMPQSGYVKDV